MSFFRFGTCFWWRKEEMIYFNKMRLSMNMKTSSAGIFMVILVEIFSFTFSHCLLFSLNRFHFHFFYEPIYQMHFFDKILLYLTDSILHFLTNQLNRMVSHCSHYLSPIHSTLLLFYISFLNNFMNDFSQYGTIIWWNDGDILWNCSAGTAMVSLIVISPFLPLTVFYDLFCRRFYFRFLMNYL
jgi:hypothetical protein